MGSNGQAQPLSCLVPAGERYYLEKQLGGGGRSMRARQSLTAPKTTRIKAVAQNNSKWQTGLSLHGRMLKSPHLFLIK